MVAINPGVYKFPTGIRYITGSVALDQFDRYVLIANTISATITLAAPSRLTEGLVVTVTKTTNNTEAVTFSTGSGSIVGSSTLYVQNDSVTLFCDGTDYYVVDANLQAHACEIRRNAAQSIASGAVVPIAFDTVGADNSGLEDIANDRIVIRRAGIYVLTAMASLPNIDALNSMNMRVYINGTAQQRDRKYGINGSELINALVTVTTQVAAGDLITAAISHNDGAAINTPTALDDQPKLSAAEVL